MRPTAALTYVLCVTGARLGRLSQLLSRLADGFGAGALDPDAQREVTVRIYDAEPSHAKRIFDWEREWFARDLPKPPAKVLVGACGRGREVSVLLEAGYSVLAFDPAEASAERCKRDHPAAHVIAGVSYEDLCASQSNADVDAIRAAAPFDAVLLGWGSLTHVVEGEDHPRILRALGELAPHGPLLASFFLKSRALPGRGRLEQAAARIGRFLSASPNAPERVSSSDPVRCYARVGFTYHFDSETLKTLASSVGRSVTLYTGEFAHATFHGPGTAPARPTQASAS